MERGKTLGLFHLCNYLRLGSAKDFKNVSQKNMNGQKRMGSYSLLYKWKWFSNGITSFAFTLDLPLPGLSRENPIERLT